MTQTCKSLGHIKLPLIILSSISTWLSEHPHLKRDHTYVDALFLALGSMEESSAE